MGDETMAGKHAGGPVNEPDPNTARTAPEGFPAAPVTEQFPVFDPAQPPPPGYPHPAYQFRPPPEPPKHRHVPGRWTPAIALWVAIAAAFFAIVSGGAKSSPGPRGLTGPAGTTSNGQVICLHYASPHVIAALSLPVGGKCPPHDRPFMLP